MAFGNRNLRKVQISNVEGTPGTAEAATEILYFENFDVKAQGVEFYMPKADRGTLAKNVETPFPIFKVVEMKGDGTLYDRMMVFLATMSIRGNNPVAAVGGLETLAYLWTFLPALGALNTPDQTDGIDVFTIEDGDNVQAYEQEHCFVKELEISGAAKEDVKFDVTLSGRQVTNTTFTGALTEPAARYYAFQNSKLFIDTSWAGLGGTQKSGVFAGFKWNFKPGFSERFVGDGNLYFAALNEGDKEVDLELTFIRDSSIVEAELVKYLAQTLTFIRIALFSQGEIDSGQANPSYIYLDMALRYYEWPELDDSDGQSTITVKAKTFKDPTSGKAFQVLIKTAMAAFA